MADNTYFFQDFLFENLPVNEQDFPEVEIKTVTKDEAQVMGEEIISLDYLLRCNRKEEWDTLFDRIKDKTVLIKNDVDILNQEIKQFKEFYLRTYFYNIDKYCKECFVIK